jgi:hypothetical protein
MTTSTQKVALHYGRRRQKLRQLFGEACLLCGATEELQFAHIHPTGLRGPGRGKYARIRDVWLHPRDYVLLCKGCHRELDGQEINPREIEDKAWSYWNSSEFMTVVRGSTPGGQPSRGENLPTLETGKPLDKRTTPDKETPISKQIRLEKGEGGAETRSLARGTHTGHNYAGSHSLDCERNARSLGAPCVQAPNTESPAL